MKPFILAICLLLVGVNSFSQKTNGTIYIEHPYIDVVNKAVKAYLDKDEATNKSFYADSARVWYSGMEKWMSIADALKMWKSDFDMYDDIKMKVVGYPDYLVYTKDNVQVVQSWWKWTGKSKKTGKLVTIDLVQFDFFNKDGKIVMESDYGNFPTGPQ